MAVGISQLGCTCIHTQHACTPGSTNTCIHTQQNRLGPSDACTCRETGSSLPDNQRQHQISRAPKDVLPLHKFANYCAPSQPLLRALFDWIRSPHPFTLSMHSHPGVPTETCIHTQQGICGCVAAAHFVLGRSCGPFCSAEQPGPQQASGMPSRTLTPAPARNTLDDRGTFPKEIAQPSRSSLGP